MTGGAAAGSAVRWGGTLYIHYTLRPDVRTLILAAAVAASLACHSAGAKSEDGLKFRTLTSGSQSRHDRPGQQVILAPTADSYARLWSSLVGEGNAPAVNFEREAVLFIMAGQRPTGGYSIAVKNIAQEGDTLIVDAPVNAPPADSMVIQVLTSPFAVVAIDRVDVGRVHWKNADESNAQPQDR